MGRRAVQEARYAQLLDASSQLLIVENLDDDSNPGKPYKLMLGGGKCQSRKTPLKLCMFIMGRLLGVSTLLLTTGTSGRDDLFFKFTIPTAKQ